MKIALLQMNTSMVPEDNLSALLVYAADAVAGGATLLFTPECTNVMALGRSAILPLTYFEQDDPCLKAMQQFAATNRVTIFLGSLMIKIADDRLVNRSYVLGPDGEIVSHYDKMHLFDVDLDGGESYRESALYQAGESPVMVTAAGGAVTAGLSICYDLRFPYLYRHYAEQGANLLTVPAAFTVPTGKAHWHILLRARAIETGCFVVAAAQSGMHQTGRATFGHSLVISPWGDVLLDAGGDLDNPAVGAHICDIDITDVDKIRAKIPSLQHGRWPLKPSST